jgi:hypothetical protein
MKLSTFTKATAFGKDVPKIWHLAQKTCNKISAEMSVKQNNVFGAMFFLLVSLHIAQISW